MSTSTSALKMLTVNNKQVFVFQWTIWATYTMSVWRNDIDGLLQEIRNFNALAMELILSYTNPMIQNTNTSLCFLKQMRHNTG